jgi:hypothetical protein
MTITGRRKPEEAPHRAFPQNRELLVASVDSFHCLSRVERNVYKEIHQTSYKAGGVSGRWIGRRRHLTGVNDAALVGIRAIIRNAVNSGDRRCSSIRQVAELQLMSCGAVKPAGRVTSARTQNLPTGQSENSRRIVSTYLHFRKCVAALICYPDVGTVKGQVVGAGSYGKGPDG